MVRELKQLQDFISISVVEPILTDQGWRFGDFPGANQDTLNGATYMHELYSQADPLVNGRATVPVLWDKHKKTIVNNESADIVRMLNSAFSHLAPSSLDLYPAHLADDIDALNKNIYEQLNNGVYQAGFASSQAAYNEAYDKVFQMLDALEETLSDGRAYLLGEQLTETDIRTFVTLVRFDGAYHGIFKCNRNTLSSMENLQRYMTRIYQLDGIAETVNMQHIKAGYYSIKALNPSGIVPQGPALSWLNK